MSTTGACSQGIRTWYRGVETGIVVANKIIAKTDLEARTEPAAKGRVQVINTRVNDSDFDAPTFYTEFVKLVNMTHRQRRVHS